jgi:hypothetical protein
MDSDTKDFILAIGTKLDDINKNLTDLQVVSAKQEVNLSEHMRRTEIAEERQDLLESEIKPILQGMNFLKKITKLVAFLGALYETISFWKHW